MCLVLNGHGHVCNARKAWGIECSAGMQPIAPGVDPSGQRPSNGWRRVHQHGWRPGVFEVHGRVLVYFSRRFAQVPVPTSIGCREPLLAACKAVLLANAAKEPLEIASPSEPLSMSRASIESGKL